MYNDVLTVRKSIRNNNYLVKYIYNREIPFEPEDPSRDNVESPRLAKGKES